MDSHNYLKVLKSPEVYSPQEDSFFLTDVLMSQFHKEFDNYLCSLLVCEVGVGSGIISIVLAKNLPQIHFLGVDISPYATRLCYNNMSDWLKPTQFDVLCMDSLRGFNPHRFRPDIIFFNPPYVKTSQKELEQGFVEKMWAGGPSGTVVIQRFLKDLSRFSFRKCFFLSSSYNANELLEINFKGIFEFRIIAEKTIENERLQCYEVVKYN